MTFKKVSVELQVMGREEGAWLKREPLSLVAVTTSAGVLPGAPRAAAGSSRPSSGQRERESLRAVLTVLLLSGETQNRAQNSVRFREMKVSTRFKNVLQAFSLYIKGQ